MTPIADMIEKMSAEGVPMSIIVLAVRTAELAMSTGKSGGIPVDTAAEKRRAYDRERKAEKRISGGKSGGIPPEQSNALPSLENNSSQNSTEKKEKKEEAPKRKSGHALPDDWRPSDSHYRLAEERGRSRADVESKADEVRLWAKSNAHRAIARKSDWDAMFTGCLSRDWPKGTTNGSRTHARADNRRSGADDFFAGLAEVAADIDRDGAMARPADADIPRGRFEIDGSRTP